MTSAIAISSVSCTSNTACRIAMDRSNSGCISIDGGTCARKFGNRARTESTTSTVLASG